MSKDFKWTDVISAIPSEAQQDLELFLNFSELRTGRPTLAESRLLETLSVSISKRRYVN